MILKLDMQHWGLKFYKVNINGDPGFTLTYFTARSNLARSKAVVLMWSLLAVFVLEFRFCFTLSRG